MEIHYFIAFNLALLAAIASPGPALLVAIRTTLSSGRAAGIAIGCGLGLVAAFWTLMALMGLEAVFKVVPWAYFLLKMLGAAYLLYIAYQTWKGSTKRITDTSKAPANAFRDGVFINLSNPKSVLFAAAVLIAIFPPEMSYSAKFLVVLNHVCVEILFYTFLAMIMGSETVRAKYLGIKIYLDRFAAVVLSVLAFNIALTR